MSRNSFPQAAASTDTPTASTGTPIRLGTRRSSTPAASSSGGTTNETSLAEQAEQLPFKASARLQKLVAMPRLRGVQLRNGKELSFRRMTSHEAILASTRGQIAAKPCIRCKKGAGPFEKCIIIEGEMNGGCNNCHFSSKSCPFRKGNTRTKASNMRTEIRELKKDLLDMTRIITRMYERLKALEAEEENREQGS
ncbi:hypothetical protein BDZ91DRAFT_752071 [Kalaharituber pfeilii]|nr:hypothetical protein BDZ91DRAFT_752071 [Kalaharituber pfeilii]